MMAVKACRDYAIHERGIKRPQMVLPTTAHPAFDKAAAYLKVKIIHVRVDPNTTSVDLKAMKRAITRNTCMVSSSFIGLQQFLSIIIKIFRFLCS